MLEKNNLFLLGRGRFVYASNNTPFSAGTEGQPDGLSLDTYTGEATEKTKYLLGRDVAGMNHIVRRATSVYSLNELF